MRGAAKKSANWKSSSVESVRSNKIGLTDMSENIGDRDVLYLFACLLEWRTRRNLAAYQELLAALDDHDNDSRRLAESLLHRSSPRPELTAIGIESCEGSAVSNRELSGKPLQSYGQVHNGDTSVELTIAISRDRIRGILAVLAAI